jgi:hypothetical protein
MLVDGRHELGVERFGVRRGNNDAAAGMRVQPAKSAKCYDALSFARTVWSNQCNLDAFIPRTMIDSDIGFELPVVKLEVKADLRKGKNVVKDFGFRVSNPPGLESNWILSPARVGHFRGEPGVEDPE